MLQYTRAGNVFTVTAATTAEADRFAHLLDEQPNDLGDLTAKNAARAALMAEWERLRDQYDAQEQVAASGDKAETAKLRAIGEQVKAAYKRLQDDQQ